MEESKVLESKKYGPREMRLILSEKRGKPISDPTWFRWKKAFGMKPDNNGEYDQEDKEILEGLIEAIKAGWSIEKYKAKLEEEVNNAECIQQEESREFNHTIEVNAAAC